MKLDAIDWYTVPDQVSGLVKAGSTIFGRIRAVVATLPKPKHDIGIWFNPKTQTVCFAAKDGESEDLLTDWFDGLKVKGIKAVECAESDAPHPNKGPWIRVKTAAVQSVFGPMAHVGGWKDNAVTNLFGGASPLSAALASGALGAGAGYLGGTLLENLFPEEYLQRGRLRKALAAVGGGLGAIPGLWSASAPLKGGGGALESFTTPYNQWEGKGWTKENASQPNALNLINTMLDTFIQPDPMETRLMNKIADAGLPDSGSITNLAIDRDRFNRVVWEDPFTPTPYKGSVSGILEGAAQVAGDSSPMVYPTDVGRLAIGMGSGYVSGMIVGKVLAGLANITPTAQKTLQRAGTWAGFIKNVVPMMFGR